MQQLHTDIQNYTDGQNEYNANICHTLAQLIGQGLGEAEQKVLHAHPVWFLKDNPDVGYSVQKTGVRLLFWGDRSFDEPDLISKSRFQDASIFYTSVYQINNQKLATWLEKSKTIQWYYKNIIKRQSRLERMRP